MTDRTITINLPNHITMPDDYNVANADIHLTPGAKYPVLLYTSVATGADGGEVAIERRLDMASADLLIVIRIPADGDDIGSFELTEHGPEAPDPIQQCRQTLDHIYQIRDSLNQIYSDPAEAESADTHLTRLETQINARLRAYEWHLTPPSRNT